MGVGWQCELLLTRICVADRMKLEKVLQGSMFLTEPLAEIVNRDGLLSNLGKNSVCLQYYRQKNTTGLDACREGMVQIVEYFIDCAAEMYSDEACKSQAMMEMDLDLWALKAMRMARMFGFHPRCAQNLCWDVQRWVKINLLKKPSPGLELRSFKSQMKKLG